MTRMARRDWSGVSLHGIIHDAEYIYITGHMVQRLWCHVGIGYWILIHWVNEQASSGKNGQYGLIQIFTVN